jgi:hypothetical protein
MRNPLLWPRTRPIGLLVCLLIGLATLLPWPPAAQAGGVVGAGTPASCSEAALDARLAGGGTIRFNCGPAPFTIGVSSVKQVTVNTSIDGGDLIALSGGGATGIFRVHADVSLRLSGLTIRSGKSSMGGGVFNEGTLLIDRVGFLENQADAGGALYNLDIAVLTIDNSTFAGNSASFGGAIRNLGGTVTVRGSTFSDNIVLNNGDGGAILNRVGSLSVTGSLFNNNQGGSVSGGGIENNDRATVAGSVFTSNRAGASGGGGIYNGLNGRLSVTSSTFVSNIAGGAGGGGLLLDTGTLTITNSTFSANTAGTQGSGGFYNSLGTATIVNSTFAGNSAGLSGAGNISGTLTLSNTIVAGGQPKNCGGAPASQGHNLDSGASCGFAAAGDLTSTDPLLGTLRNEGGAPPTHALLPGSPAIDHGGARCPATDQRGVPRPRGAACDIGAYEYGAIIYIPLARKE